MLFLSQSLIGDNEIRIKALTSSHHTPSQLGRQASWAFLRDIHIALIHQKASNNEIQFASNIRGFPTLDIQFRDYTFLGKPHTSIKKGEISDHNLFDEFKFQGRLVSIFQCPCLNHLCGGLAPKHRQNNQATKNQTKGAKLQMNQRGIREIIMQKAF